MSDYSKKLSCAAASGHQALAIFVIVVFAAACGASKMGSDDREIPEKVAARAIGMLRSAARSSVRAERTQSVADKFADACQAKVYVDAVERIVTPAQISKISGVSIDAMRSHVDSKLSEAREDLEDACSKKEKVKKEPLGAPQSGRSSTKMQNRNLKTHFF